jgi:hypothetical protein
MCYGYYCEGDNVFVHWEDRCAQQHTQSAAPPVPQHQTQPANNMGFGNWF